MRKRIPIFYSALLLTAVNLLLRFVGTGFQVFLSSRIGAEGIGLLQMVLSVGSMATVAGMAGIRTGTMYLTAEEIGKQRPQHLKDVLSGCILYSLLCSGAVGAVLYLFAPQLAQMWIGNPDTVGPLRLFAAFLPVNCLTGVLVGYFTGSGRIGTLAAVEVAEQLCTMTCTLGLLHFLGSSSGESACLCVVLGSALGSCVTLLSLVVLRLLERSGSRRCRGIGRRLWKTAVPLAIADDLRTGISTVENLMVPKRLALYPGVASPLAAFGMVCGMVFPILMFPTAILFGLTELLIPELARCSAAGHTERIRYLASKSLRIALLYGTLCGGILLLCSQELCDRLYASPEAGRYLKWFSPLAVMLYCDAVTDASIKGLGQQQASVRYNIFTNVMDVVLLFLLLPKYGITGYFFSFTVTHVINFILSLRRLVKCSRICLSLPASLLTLIAAAGSAWCAGFVPDPWMRSLCYVIILFCLLFLLKIVTAKDILWLKSLITGRTAP